MGLCPGFHLNSGGSHSQLLVSFEALSEEERMLLVLEEATLPAPFMGSCLSFQLHSVEPGIELT